MIFRKFINPFQISIIMDKRIVLAGINDPEILEVFGDICDMMGYTVVEAEDPEDLVQKARLLPHDKCFMDANYGNGCTADISIAVRVRQVYVERFGQDISARLLTTTGYHEAVLAVRQAGIPLAEKPLELDVLKEFLG